MNTTQQKSIYRFAPGTEHKRTAIALKDGRFLEVKPTKQMFTDGDAWSASFMGEGALLADGIAAGHITVEEKGAYQKRIVEEQTTSDIKRLTQLHAMYCIRPTFKIRYGYNSVGNRIQNERGACSVYVMSKDGSLHNVGFTPRKGGSLVISGYTENGNSQKRIVAQRFCDISSDFAEDAPLFICVKPGSYGNLGWLDSAGSFYRVDVDGNMETPQKILYINTGNESVHREFHRKSYSPETAAGLQRIRDAGYLVGCICNLVNNYRTQTRYTTVMVGGDIRDYQYDRWSLADFVKRAEKKLFGN